MVVWASWSPTYSVPPFFLLLLSPLWSLSSTPRCCVVAGQVSFFKFPSVVGAERVLRGIVDVASSGHMTVCAATKISSSPLWCTTATWHMTRSVHSHANIYIYGPILQVLTTTSIHFLYFPDVALDTFPTFPNFSNL